MKAVLRVLKENGLLVFFIVGSLVCYFLPSEISQTGYNILLITCFMIVIGKLLYFALDKYTCTFNHLWQNCKCTRCGATRKHSWGEWEQMPNLPPCERIRQCQEETCAVTETRGDFHDFDKGQFVEATSCKKQMTCKACGHSEIVEWDSFHDYKNAKCQRCGQQRPANDSSDSDDAGINQTDMGGYSYHVSRPF